MKNKKVSNIAIYILLIIVIAGIMYFCYTLFINYNHPNDLSGDIPNLENYTALFVKNGADSIEYSKLTCSNVNGKCQITLPNIVKDDGYVLGWNISNENYAKYDVGEVVELTNNQMFYAITYSINTLTIASESLDYLSQREVSCKVYNKEESCTVTIPNYNKVGYENRGYSLRSDSLTGVIYPNREYSLKNDVILYPIYNTLTRGKVINVFKTIQKYGITIEIENGCKSSTYNEYLNYLDSINKKAGYLLVGSKITFLNSETFDSLWGSKYMGMNYGPNALRLFDVKCPDSLNYDYYATMVHELAHTWDFYYSNYFDKNISDENDYVNLFSKYQNMDNRPFRDYSYSNIREFMADTIRYYYFKYLEPRGIYQNLEYPSDVKKVVEKYICIANNGYDKTSC